MKILIADDDNYIRDVIKRTLQKFDFKIIEANNGTEALFKIKLELPELVILDLNMPNLNGKQIIEYIRADLRTQMISVIVVTGHDEMDLKIETFKIGADDYITKPFNPLELALKINNMITRQFINISLNPLTKLPGSPVIEMVANQKISRNEKFAFLYIDIDNFKAYNDCYGYLKGDEVIKKVALILNKLYDKYLGNYFAGHIGGDDFVVITNSIFGEEIAINIINEFKESLKYFYNENDYKSGYIVSKDRRGNIRYFNLMSLSISIVTNEKRIIQHYGKIIDIAFEIKRYLKTKEKTDGGMYLKDRRSDFNVDNKSY